MFQVTERAKALLADSEGRFIWKGIWEQVTVSKFKVCADNLTGSSPGRA